MRTFRPAAPFPALTLIVLALLAAAAPASAQEAGEGPLSARIDPSVDRAVARALTERYGQIEGLESLEVHVEAGVVRVSGEVINAAAQENAVSIARRTEGVVEVIDRIQVTRDVTERVVPAVQKLQQRFYDFLAWLPLLGLALILFLVFWWLGKVLYQRPSLFSRFSDNRFVQDLLRQIARLVLLLIGVLLALEILEATALVGAVLGTAGVVGLAVGFAFRDLAENYIASVLLSLRQPFAPNDMVEIDGQCGKVLRLTSRATVLMTMDGNHLRIPNSQVYKGVILNYSRNPLRRFDFAVGLGVDEGAAEAQQLGLEVLRRTKGVLGDPGPEAIIQALGDSTVNLRFYGWVDQRQSSFTGVKGEAIRLIKEAFDAADIDMPEPIYRVRVEGRSGGSFTITETDADGAPRKSASADRGKAQHAAPDGGKASPRTPRVPTTQEIVHEVTERASPAGELPAEDAIDRQIAQEQAEESDEDLLNPNAPRE